MNQSVHKILPVTYPPITSYQHHANLLSVLSNYEYTLPWILENYIQIYIFKNYCREDSFCDFFFPFTEINVRDYDLCPWVDKQTINRNLIDHQWDSISDFIVEAIDNDFYVDVMINQSNVPHYTFSDNHDIFVYGYDIQRQEFYAADFFDDSGYRYQKVSFRDLENAYLNIEWVDPDDDYFSNCLYLLSIKKEIKKFKGQFYYKFSVDNIVNVINEYLLNGNYGYWYRGGKSIIAYGVEYYDVLEHLIGQIMENCSLYFDIRPFQILYEHKKIMLLRLLFLRDHHYLVNFDYFYNCYQEIENEMLIARNLLLKGKIAGNHDFFKKTIEILNSIKNKEQEVLRFLTHSIKLNDN
jgi:hypothetical protein